MINRIRRSPLAHRQLQDSSGYRIILPAETRWSTLWLTYNRIVRIQEEINAVADEYNFEALDPDDVTQISQICDMIGAFKDMTLIQQQKNVPIISLVFPGINNLIEHLQ